MDKTYIKYTVWKDQTNLFDGTVKADDCPLFRYAIPRWLNKGFKVEMKTFKETQDV